MRRRRIKPGQLVDVTLTPQERDLILERTLIDDEMEGCLRGATARGATLVVRLTLDDVDDLAGHVAAEANHCSEPRVRRVLDAVYDRLAGIEHTFTDGEGPGRNGRPRVEPVHGEAGAVSRVHLLLHEDSREAAGRIGSPAILPRHAAGRASDDQDARCARTDRASTRCSPLHTASVDAGAVA